MAGLVRTRHRQEKRAGENQARYEYRIRITQDTSQDRTRQTRGEGSGWLLNVPARTRAQGKARVFFLAA